MPFIGKQQVISRGGKQSTTLMSLSMIISHMESILALREKFVARFFLIRVI